jgi:hypothetical protein
MNVEIVIWVAAAVVLAAGITALVVRSRRRKQPERREAERVYAERLAHVKKLIEGVENDDAEAYNGLDKPVPGLKGYVWRSFIWRLSGADAELNERRDKAVDAYDERRKYEKYTKLFGDTITVWSDEAKSRPERIRALVAFIKHWETLGLRAKNAKRLAAEFASQKQARERLNELVRIYALELAEAAGGSADNLDAFQRLYALRHAIQRPTSVPYGKDQFEFYKVEPAWPRIENWLTLVDRYIASPTLWELGVNPEHRPIEFPRRVVLALESGSRLDAKIAQAYLVASPELRDLFREGLLVAGIYCYATTGKRPRLDQLLATEPVAEPR